MVRGLDQLLLHDLLVQFRDLFEFVEWTDKCLLRFLLCIFKREALHMGVQVHTRLGNQVVHDSFSDHGQGEDTLRIGWCRGSGYWLLIIDLLKFLPSGHCAEEEAIQHRLEEDFIYEKDTFINCTDNEICEARSGSHFELSKSLVLVSVIAWLQEGEPCHHKGIEDEFTSHWRSILDWIHIHTMWSMGSPLLPQSKLQSVHEPLWQDQLVSLVVFEQLEVGVVAVC